MEEECLPFVKSREIDAVVVDVPASATHTGVRGMNAGGRNIRPFNDVDLDVCDEGSGTG